MPGTVQPHLQVPTAQGHSAFYGQSVAGHGHFAPPHVQVGTPQSYQTSFVSIGQVIPTQIKAAIQTQPAQQVKQLAFVSATKAQYVQPTYDTQAGQYTGFSSSSVSRVYNMDPAVYQQFAKLVMPVTQQVAMSTTSVTSSQTPLLPSTINSTATASYYSDVGVRGHASGCS